MIGANWRSATLETSSRICRTDRSVTTAELDWRGAVRGGRHTIAAGHVDGYGGLPSALDLKVKFEKKADGGGEHDADDSAVRRLEQHIEVVKLMRDTYAAAIGKLQQTDQSAAGEMTAQTEGGG